MPTPTVTVTLRLSEELVAAIDELAPRGQRNAWCSRALQAATARAGERPNGNVQAVTQPVPGQPYVTGSGR